MPAKKRTKTKANAITAKSFVEVVAAPADERIEVEIGDVRVRLCPGFDPADLACVLEVVGRR